MSDLDATDDQSSSTRPYLVRALHDWCTDNGYTPYIAVFVDRSVQVPLEYVKNNEIVLNVSFDATSGLKMGNDYIEFRARFGGVARDIIVPVSHVIAIYARENGQGMAFPVPALNSGAAASEQADAELEGGARGPDTVPAPLKLAPVPGGGQGGGASSPLPDPEAPEPPPPGGGRPSLKRVK